MVKRSPWLIFALRVAPAFAIGIHLVLTGTVNVKNSLIAENKGVSRKSSTGDDVFGRFVSLGHNLIGIADGSTGFEHDVLDDLVGSAADPIDPRIEPLPDNDGPTQTHSLKPDESPAIDKGDSVDAPTTDQRGMPRPSGEGVDIGAFELQTIPMDLAPMPRIGQFRDTKGRHGQNGIIRLRDEIFPELGGTLTSKLVSTA
jgi:hypothetical protein